MSVSIIDIFILGIFLFLGIRGIFLGFMRCIVPPVAMLLAMLIAAIVFTATRNVIATALIAVFGPFALGWGIKLGLRAFNDGSKELSVASRVSGAFTNMLSGAIIILPLVALVGLFPLKNFGLGAVQSDADRSVICAMIKNVLPQEKQKTKPVLAGSSTASAPFKDPALAADADMEALQNDPRVQKLFSDPELLKAAESGNYARLMTNPDILELAADPQFIAKALRAYEKMKPAASSPTK